MSRDHIRSNWKLSKRLRAPMERELPKNAKPSEGNEDEKQETPEVNPKNEKYINDLEKALRDFKILSEAYEDEKSHHHRGSQHSNSEEDETSSEELNSGSDEDEDEEENELEEPTTAKAADKKERREKGSEDDSEDVSEEESPKESRSSKKDHHVKEKSVSAESTIAPKEETKSAKQLRRRPKKV
ncbi:hypothetical protein COOONC_19530 [Cooperia oncophora]